MDKTECPFCGCENCEITSTGSEYSIVVCPDCGINVNIEWMFLNAIDSSPFYQKALNAIQEKTLYEPYLGEKRRWYFYYDDREIECEDDAKINIYTLLKDYPQGFIEIVNRSLLNLAFKYSTFGQMFDVDYENFRLFYPVTGEYEESEGTLKMLIQMGYVSRGGVFPYPTISAEGWKKIESLKKKRAEIKQGFVAMRFGDETAEIREGFRKAIKEAGYSMRAIDEKEHNNQIVPEIFYEIERSKFVVVDVTYPNYGAYYEAGYAQGLGKEVIVCCRKDAFENKDGKFERPHFDISQKSMVIWTDIEDLKTRLTKRIQATVK